MAEAFQQVAEPRRRQVALVCGESRFTYGDLLDRTHRLAWGLHTHGINKGDRVAAFLSPGADYACLFFALAEIGGVFIPLNPQLTGAQPESGAARCRPGDAGGGATT